MNVCVARNGHGHAAASPPRAACSSAICACVAADPATAHARCQPMPWIAWGESPKFRASACSRPSKARRAPAMRFE
ncbi:MAG: hypothetical protein U1F64_09050 [Burkholderiales bacterium]